MRWDSITRRCGVAAVVMTSLVLVSVGTARADCTTADPPAQIDPGQGSFTTDDATIQTMFTNARAAEGCNVPLVLPAGFDQMTAAQQIVWLINNERTIRGLAPLTPDTSIMQQIALNHSAEEAQYSYTGHWSPINTPMAGGAQNPVLRQDAVPMQTNWDRGEAIQWGTSPAGAVFFWLYDDPQWPHRHLLLAPDVGGYIGVGALLGTGQYNNYYTVDTADPSPWPFPGEPEPAQFVSPPYTPPATTDTGAPVMGAISDANGTATVTGVADNPANVNDTGANPLVPAITGVVFYTNNITGDGFAGTFNTVPATQTSPGTWTAQITVNPGDVLHAVAVDGSGNYTDMTMAAPATTLTNGANTLALPAAAATGATGMSTAARLHATRQPAVTPTAAALVASIDRQLHRRAVRDVRVFAGGHWTVYRPGTRSRDVSLWVGEGVVVDVRGHGRWRPRTGDLPAVAPRIHLHRGWNFVGVPYPQTDMTCHAVRLEIARAGDRLQEISVGAEPNTGRILKPHHGSWGNDLKVYLSNAKGFWIRDTGADTWTPSPTGYHAVVVKPEP